MKSKNTLIIPPQGKRKQNIVIDVTYSPQSEEDKLAIDRKIIDIVFGKK